MKLFFVLISLTFLSQASFANCVYMGSKTKRVLFFSNLILVPSPDSVEIDNQSFTCKFKQTSFKEGIFRTQLIHICKSNSGAEVVVSAFADRNQKTRAIEHVIAARKTGENEVRCRIKI